ncbi:MAG: hypothetical protein HY303_19260 [Candidatus Wallbacteria bacterium]|nr:hypothetical protein [Candidatus Wallbacteria bacterium]
MDEPGTADAAKLGAHIRKIEATEGEIHCGICGVQLVGQAVLCAVCESPFHLDCWQYNKGCATYGCQGAPGKPQREPIPLRIGADARASEARHLAWFGLAALVFGIWTSSRPSPSVPRSETANTTHAAPAGPGVPDWSARVREMHDLSRSKGDPESLRKLLAGLRYENAVEWGQGQVRVEAARSLAAAGWKEAIPALREALEKEPRAYCSPAYAVALHQLGDTRGTSALRKWLGEFKPDPPGKPTMGKFVTLAAVDGVGMAGLSEFGGDIQRLLEVRDSDICRRALWALARLRHAPAVAAAAEKLQHSDCAVVYEAAVALVAFGARDRRAAISSALQSCPGQESVRAELLDILDGKRELPAMWPARP